MTNSNRSASPELPTPDESQKQSVSTLHVCTSCRPPGAPREPREHRPGFILYQQLRKAFEESPYRKQLKVVPAECLSLCPRPCGIALSKAGSWTYLFGDQKPDETTDEIVKCVAQYMETPDGFMARDQRPKSLRRSILGRVPPIKGGQ